MFDEMYEANEGVNQEVADPVVTTEEEPSFEEVDYSEKPEVTEEETVDEQPKAEEKPVQSAEDNAKYAAARREAEAQAKAEKERMDNIFAERFKGYKNPITGEEITGVESYISALDAQKEYQAKQQAKQAGLDPSLIDEIVNNNPVIKQAQAVIAEQERLNQEKMIQTELEQIHALDSTIKTPDDLLNMENFGEFKGYVNKGYSFIDAYKLANFSKLQNKQFEAAQQSAINKAKSTSHLNATNGIATGSKEMVDIPTSELAVWKECYPGLSMSELKKKYNDTL